MRILTAILLVVSLGLSTSPGWAGQSTPPTALGSAGRLAELKEKVEKDNRANPVSSVAWAEEALRLLAAEPNPGAETWFLLALARDLDMLGDFPKASAYLERGRKLAAANRDTRSRLLLEIEAAALCTNTEKLAEARDILGSIIPSVEAYRTTHPQDYEMVRSLGRSYRLLAWGFQTSGRFLEAIRANQNAQNISSEIRDLRGQAQVLDNMGNLYANMGRLDEAVAAHRQAISLAEQIADLDLQAICHNSLANTFGHRNETAFQLAELSRASALAVKAGDTYLQLIATMNLADAHLREKDYRAALACAEGALRLPDIARYPMFVAISQVNRGIALNRLGNNSEGLKSLQEGLQHIKATHAKNETAEVLGNLAEEFAFAGDFRRAYETELEFKALSDELKPTDDQKRVAEASAAFESDKKQIQIDALERDRHTQARLKLLWIALGALGFSAAGILVISLRRRQRAHEALADLNGRNQMLIGDLQAALAEVRALQGLIPICAHCKKIRDDKGYWNQMESYIQSRSGATFSHGICPECARGVLAEASRESLSR